MLLVSPTTVQESIEHTNRHFFTMGEGIQSISGAVDTFFRVNRDIKTIGILCWDDTWGRAYLKVWKERAAANGVRVEAELCTVDYASDFRTDVARLAAKKVDGVLVAHMGAVVLQRMREQRFSPKILATSNIVEDITVKRAPAELFEGVFITDWRPNEGFRARFRAKFGRDPFVGAHNSYETLRSVAKALSANQREPVEALRTVKYVGVAGEVDFSESSFANRGVAGLYRVRRGELEEVR